MSAAVSRLPDHAAILQDAARDVPVVLRGLGVTFRKSGSRWLILCPAHTDHTPSCAVFIGRNDGKLCAHCFACGWSAGDVVALAAAVARLDVRDGRQFRQALDLAAAAVGVTLDHGQPGAGVVGPVPPPAPRRPIPVPAPAFPPSAEVSDLWRRCLPVESCPDVAAQLAERGIDPGMVDLYDLARVLPDGGAVLPRWAYPWRQTHRLMVPVFDAAGVLRGLRARRTVSDESQPKVRLPAGFTGDGVVMACPIARKMLATGQRPDWLPTLAVIVTEGEPDYMTAAARVSDANATPPAVLGVFRGAWSDELAARIPDGSTVTIRTHDDPAGVEYGAAVYASLASRYAAGRLAVHVSDQLAAALESETP